MKIYRSVKAIGLCAFLTSVVGCQQPAHEMNAIKGPPPRPAELDVLNQWAGSWSGTGELTIHAPEGPQTMQTTFAEKWEWACDNQFLMGHFEWKMGEGDAMHGVALMTWVPEEKEYHSWEFLGSGMVNLGEMKYDEKAGLWRMEGKGRDPFTGEPSRGEGTAKMVDDKTMEWNFTMWDSWKLKKKMEGKGVSRKQ